MYRRAYYSGKLPGSFHFILAALAEKKTMRRSCELTVQKVFSGSGRAGRLRFMGKYIGHRLVARPELDNTFWSDSTSTLCPIVKVIFHTSCVAPFVVEPSKAQVTYADLG